MPRGAGERGNAMRTQGNTVTLSTGRIIEETRMENGATAADPIDGGEMTEAEWDEYCAYLRSLSLAQSRERLARRQAAKDQARTAIRRSSSEINFRISC